MMPRSASSENAGSERRVNPESSVVRAAVVLRKFLRLGKHSDGNMAVSDQGRTDAVVLGRNFDFNLILAQNHMPAALWSQLQIALAAVGWQVQLVGQFR